jgi:hypothetical protein
MSVQKHYAFHLDSGEEVGTAVGSSTARHLAMREAYDNQRTIHVYLLGTGEEEYMFTVDYERV